jgi:ABC-2 type transport system ATP-binding protein
MAVIQSLVMSEDSVLKVEQLKKTYRLGITRSLFPKKQEVLKGLNFEVKQGQTVGFLGGNGAGKTTTLKCVLGLAFPDSGEITFFGNQKLSNDVKRRVGFLPERPYFYDYLTGREFLQFYAQVSSRFSKKVINEKIDYLLKRVDLTFAKDKPLNGYSKGMLQKIGMAQALIHEPDFVILDEPMSGLDPDGRFYLAELIRETAKEGKTIFFSSHLLNDVERLCSQLIILKGGECVYEGSTSELLDTLNPEIEIHYSSDGQLLKKSVRSIGDAQQEIDQLRKSGANIMQMQKSRQSLEEAFISVGLDKKNRDASI